jgi:hypothetical protein
MRLPATDREGRFQENFWLRCTSLCRGGPRKPWAVLRGASPGLDVQKQHTFAPARPASLAHGSLEPPFTLLVEKKNPASLNPPGALVVEKKKHNSLEPPPDPSFPRKRESRIRRVVFLIETGPCLQQIPAWIPAEQRQGLRWRHRAGMTGLGGKAGMTGWAPWNRPVRRWLKGKNPASLNPPPGPVIPAKAGIQNKNGPLSFRAVGVERRNGPFPWNRPVRRLLKKPSCANRFFQKPGQCKQPAGWVLLVLTRNCHPTIWFPAGTSGTRRLFHEH